MLRTEDSFTSHKARPTPTQGTLEVGNAPALGQRDAELILSFMTVPYLRIPLALSFFASNDRVHALQSTQLQDLLDGILFEGGNFARCSWGERKRAQPPPMIVPVQSSQLGTAHHLLVNELRHSPDTIMQSVLALTRQAIDLDTSDARSSTASVCSAQSNKAALNLAQL